MKTILGKKTVWQKKFSRNFNGKIPADFLSANMFDVELEKDIQSFIKQNKKILYAGWFKNPILKIESKTITSILTTTRQKTVFFIVISQNNEEIKQIFDSKFEDPKTFFLTENFLD